MWPEMMDRIELYLMQFPLPGKAEELISSVSLPPLKVMESFLWEQQG